MTTAPTEMRTASESTTTLEATAASKFVERRNAGERSSGFERRQFANSHATLSPDARELAEAIDAYKVEHSRRYITFEEMLKVIHSLGYQK